MKHDILIIGGGLAGLRAVVELKGTCDVAILCKTYPNLAHSGEAQGGINAAIQNVDLWENHGYDTAYGSDFLADQDAVEVLCQDAPRVIREMVEWGVAFNKNPDGSIAQRAFGAQRFNRTCYAADRTGHALLHTLYKKALEKGVHMYNEWQIVSLTTDGQGVTGVVALDMSTGELSIIEAKAVILATGGAGRVYGKTTNPENTGDGIAIAYNAGAPIMDMEMVQFHPTTLRGPNKLLSEAARGEGAYLINADGERFMKRYAPQKMELASRDVVARAEATEIKEGRGVFGDSVYLDFRHLDKETIMSKIPDIRKNGIELVGIDIMTDPIPVQPGQHYTMAGVATDVDGRTSIPGLFAAGECGCVSVHGANRLGGNSLMETLVFGRRAAHSAQKHIQGKNFRTVEKKALTQEEERSKAWMKMANSSTLMPRNIRMKMGRVMDEYVGPFRDAQMLAYATHEIQKIRKEFEGVAVTEHSGIFNAELKSAYELKFMLDLAECTIASAMHRTESRGAHTRTDYPKRDDTNWLKHILCTKGQTGPKIGYRPVTITRWKPIERKY